MSLLPRIGWRAISDHEAKILDIDQIGRCRWEVLEIVWLGMGRVLDYRAIPVAAPRCSACRDTGALDHSYWAIDPCSCRETAQ